MTREEAIDKLQNLWNEVYNEDSDGYTYAVAIDMAIEALKGGDAEMSPQTIHMQQSPSDGADLISRADVLALAEKGYIISNSNYKKVCDLINELPSDDRPSGEWIPCETSGMPPEGEAVLMSDGKHIWIDETVAWWGDRSDWIGTAWMPLPAPYKGDDTE